MAHLQGQERPGPADPRPVPHRDQRRAGPPRPLRDDRDPELARAREGALYLVGLDRRHVRKQEAHARHLGYRLLLPVVRKRSRVLLPHRRPQGDRNYERDDPVSILPTPSLSFGFLLLLRLTPTLRDRRSGPSTTVSSPCSTSRSQSRQRSLSIRSDVAHSSSFQRSE